MQFRSSVRPEMFRDALLSVVWGLLNKFFDEFKRIPTKEELVLYTRNVPQAYVGRADEIVAKISSLASAESVGEDVIVSQTTEAMREYMVESLLERGASMLSAGKISYDTLLDDMKKIVTVSVDTDLGIEVSGAVVDRVVAAERFETISTGLEGLDRVLRGGFARKQLCVAIGPSNVGKSAFLVNHAVGGAMAGKCVLLVTCELPDLSVIERVIRRVTGMERKELLVQVDEATHIVDRFFGITGSRLVVRYSPPKSFGVSELESYLDKVEVLMGFVPDEVIIDYLDEMKPPASLMKAEIRHQHRGIASAFSAVAKERDFAAITATQTNRQALDKQHITEKYIGEDYGKVQVSDVIYTICQTKEEHAAGMARVLICKDREGAGKWREVSVRADFARMYLASVDTVHPVSAPPPTEEHSRV
jgi:KaiC/GvpD/RAD55 family RecA-like ATPase